MYGEPALFLKIEKGALHDMPSYEHIEHVLWNASTVTQVQKQTFEKQTGPTTFGPVNIYLENAVIRKLLTACFQ